MARLVSRVALNAALLATTAICLATTGAHAQTADPAGPVVDEEEIVVTANKREENILTVPQSVTAIGDELIERVQADNLSDLAAYVPGLTVQSSGVDGNRLILRGLTTGGQDISPTVGVYLDDAPFGATSGFSLGALFSPDIDPFDLERVEVLRGPQGTLYGASSLGGLVKYVTREPDTRNFGVRARVETGYDEDADTESGSIRVGVNIPLIENLAALRISGYVSGADGGLTNVRTGETNINDNSRSGGRFDFLIEPSNALSVRLTGMYGESDTPHTGGVDGDGVTLEPIYDEYSGYGFFDGNARSEYTLYQGSIEYVLPNDFVLTSATSYSEFEAALVQDYTSIFQPAFAGSFGPFAANFQFFGPVNPVAERFTQEIRLASPQNTTFEWLMGLFYNQEDGHYVAGIQSTYGFGVVAPPVFLAPTVAALANYQTVSLNSTYEEIAGFANATYYITPDFDISAGLRYSQNDQHVDRTATGFLVLVGAVAPFGEADFSDEVLTESLDARWRFSDNAMLYARAATGYRPGGPNTSGASFDSDTTISYEVGLKGSALDGVLRGSVAAYYIDWTDIQLNFFNGTNTIIGNAGDAQSQGFEAEGVWTPAEGLTFAANLSYTDAEITGLKAGATGGAVIGDELPFISPWAGALRADYEWALSPGLSANIGAGVRYRDQFVTTFPGDPGASYYELPETTFVDLRGGLSFNHVDITLQVLNVGNERDLISASRSLGVAETTADALGQPALLGYAPGRTFSLSVSASF